jgi:hypothetical protein
VSGRASAAGGGAAGATGGGAAGATETGQALARLEAAVERLAIAASRPRPMATEGDSVPRAEVQAIADRLDETIARLRSALGEEDG